MSAEVLIIYNGGTIGMRPSDQGYKPLPGYLQEQMQSIPAFSKSALPTYDIIEQHPLIDSAHMHPDRWWGIAKLIEQYHDKYRGSVTVLNVFLWCEPLSPLSVLTWSFSS